MGFKFDWFKLLDTKIDDTNNDEDDQFDNSCLRSLSTKSDFQVEIFVVQGNNTYFLKILDGTEADDGPVNGRMLKNYFDPVC